MADLEFGNAAHDYVLSRYQTQGARVQFVAADVHAAFAAGAAWQKERELAAPLMVNGADDMSELRNALGTIGEGIAEMLKRQGDLSAMGLRGTDRGVAILKHLQEIGDNVRSVSGAIGDKFGVVLDAIKHVGETTEAVLDQVMPQEVVTDDASGLGKLWSDVPVKLEDVSDQTLKDLATTEQIDGRHYWQEVDRRQKERLNKMAYDDVNGRLYAAGLDLAKPGSDQTVVSVWTANQAEVDRLTEELRVAKMMEAFWRKAAAARGARVASLADQVMDMGEIIDNLTGRATEA